MIKAIPMTMARVSGSSKMTMPRTAVTAVPTAPQMP